MIMTKYRVSTDMDCTNELDCLHEAENIFDGWKDDLMSEGVTENESYVEIQKSDDDFNDYEVIKKVIAVRDNDRNELGTPKEEGFEWDYWAKWHAVKELKE
jgi:hypothetical protein